MAEPQLNTNQLNQLGSFVASSFDEHKQQYFAAKAAGQLTNAEIFYGYLSDRGFSYGDRALGVVLNDTLSGQIANLNSNNVSLSMGGADISYESDNALRIQYNLMIGHRTGMIERDGLDLTAQQQLDNHAFAYTDVGAPVEAFTMYAPLTQISQNDPAAAQALWSEVIIRDNGFFDGVLTEGFATTAYTFSSLATENQSVTELGQNVVDQINWTFNILDTVHTIGGAELVEFYDDYTGGLFQDTINDLNTFWDQDFGYSTENSQGQLESYNFYNNSSFSDSFSSLGYATDITTQFETNGWSAIGQDITSYGFGGNNFTAFGENDTIPLPTVPTYDFDSSFWDAVAAGDYVVNNTVSDFGGTLLTYQNFVSPLTFDLDNDGIETSHIYSQNVYFDIDADGYAEKVGWIDADDGQLAFDANQDGIINDITELFGDDIMPAFQKLALFDSNGDGVISALDDDYSNLLVWRDLDQDGFSDAGELQTLLETGIKEISLAETPEETFQNENFISGRATYTRTDNTTGDIADVHFLNDNVNTWFQGAQSQVFGSTYQISPEALLLPLSRGYGSLASLHIAMTDNTTLRNIMKDLVNLGSSEFGDLAGKMEAFLYEWAGVTDNDPDARTTGNGSNVDARKVDFLEAFTGVEWKQMGVTSLVGSKASVGVKKIWSEITNLITVRILVQGTLSDDIFQNATYDFVTDTLTLGDSMADIIARAQNYIASDIDQAHEFWLSMGNVLIAHQDELGVTLSDISTALDAAYGAELFISEQTLTQADGNIYSTIDGSDEVLTTNVLVGNDVANVIDGSGANDYIFGKGGDDTLRGLAGDDFLRGDDDDDIIEGGDGDDRLEGKGGVDTLIGGAGRDDLRGGDGDDTLMGGEGQDKLHGGAGADIIDGGAGADEIDYLESDQAVYVNLKTRTADGGHATGDSYQNIENITGSDFSDVLIGDDADNTINGEKGDDIIYGGKGNDSLFGADGNDMLFGEEGNDLFDGFDGAETMDGGTGNDTVNYIHPFNTSGVHADLAAGKGYLGAAKGDQYINIENLIGSEHSDILIGDDNNNVLEGREGNDILDGRGGDDILLGGAGVNQLIGGSGADTFIITPHAANAIIIHDFEPTEDVLDYRFFTTNVTTSTEIKVAALGNDTLVGIDDAHLVLLKNVAPGDLNISHFMLHPTETTLASLSIVTNIDSGVAQQGDQFGNKLFGTLFADTIDGQDGDDEIVGREGNDTLNGGLGNDRIIGGGGADILDGGDGNDSADYGDSFEGVTIDLMAGTGLGGVAQGDTLTNIEIVKGSAFDDVLIGNNSDNILSGEIGNDTLHAKGGQNNTLIGGDGNDTFVIDQISGPALPDNGTGVLVINPDGTVTPKGATPTSITFITDFEAGNAQEKIDLSGFTATEMYVVRIDDLLVNGESISGAAVYIFNGVESQMILLKDADYNSLIEDNFILPPAITFADVQWQVIGTSSNDVLLGSGNDDTVFAHEGGGDIVVGGSGDDTIYGGAEEPDLFLVSKNAGDVDTIYNLTSFYQTYHWLPGGTGNVTLGPDGTHIVDALTSRNIDGFDLSQFANIREFSDLTFTYVDTNNDGLDDKTTIGLGDGQEVIVENFNIGFGEITNQTGSFNSPEVGVVGFGTLIIAPRFGIHTDNFIFYDGNLYGDRVLSSVHDILEGGYGVDNIFGLTGDDILTGEGDDDILEGGSGNDTLDGGAGNDTLTGGDHADTYIIGQEAGATDTITDFEYWRPDERIDLSAFDVQFVDFVALKLAISQQGADTQIDLGNGQTLVLQNFDSNKLTAGNFTGNAANNLAPVAQNDVFSGTEDQDIIGNVLTDTGNGLDSDGDSDPLSVVAGTIMSAQGGNIILNADGSFTYTPVPNFNGTDSFSYTLTDGLGGLDTATVTLNVSAVNDNPIAQDETVSVFEDGVVTIDVLGNDSDIDTDSLTVVSAIGATNGNTVINPDGTITYTPNSNFNGVDSFTYTVDDGNGGTDTATVDVSINPVNDAPIAQDDNFTGQKNTDITGNILTDNGSGADSDPEGDVLSAVAETNQATAQGGSVTINVDGSFTYTPALNFNGADSFTYTLLDGQGGIDTGTVNLAINGVNDAPVVTNNGGSTDEDNTLTLTTAMLDMADTDTPAGNRVFTLQSLPANGSLSLNGTALALTETFTQQDIIDGLVTYEPDADYNGADSFDFTASDGTTTLPAQTFNLSVAAVNDGPQAVNDIITTDEDTAITLDVRSNDTDADMDSLSVVNVTQGANGSAIINPDGTVTYTPGANFNGADSFTYDVSDGNGGTSTATVDVTVNSINDNPIAQDDNFTGDEDMQIIGNIFSDNGNGVDSDVDGDPLSVVAQTIATAQGGSVVILTNGNFTYTPAAAFTGTDSFNYTVDDGQGGSDTGTVTLDVSASGPPSIDFNSANITSYDTQDVSNAFAIEDGGDTLHLSENTWKKIDFSYALTSDSVLEFDFKSTSEGEIHGIGFESDNSISNNLLFQLYGTQSWGILSEGNYAAPGEWIHVVIPVGQYYTGQASYLTFVNDDDGANPDAESFFRNVSVYEASAVNTNPIANNDTITTDEDAAVTLDVRSNDTDSDSDPLSVSGVTQGSNGSVVINPDGTLTYTPDANFNGADSFTYMISDGQGGSDMATVNVTVNAVNDAPVAQDDNFTGNEDAQITGNVLADNGNGADSDPEGDILSITAETKATAQGGSVTLLADGSFTYTPAIGFNGADSFDYTLLDGQGGSDTGTVALAVNAVDGAPVVTNNGGSTDEDGTLVLSTAMLDATDADNTDSELVFNLQSLPANGVLKLNGSALGAAGTFTQQDIIDGSVTFEPNADYNGADGFDFTLSDGTTTLPVQTFNLNITAINDAPQAVNDTVTTDEDTALTLDVRSNDTDIDLDSLTVESTTQGANGSAVINPDGTVTYTPNANFNGADSFTYDVSDGNGGTDTATVNVTINAVNDAPVAQDDSFTGDEDTQIIGNVLADNGNGADSDVDGDALNIVAETITTAQGGSVILLANGDFTYTPVATFGGADSFDYTLQDGNGGSDTGSVNLTVNAVNDAPIVTNNGGSIDEDGTLVLSAAMLNVTDSDNTPSELVFTLTAVPANDTLKLNGAGLGASDSFTMQDILDGLVTFQPDADQNGVFGFDFTLSDGESTLPNETFIMTVNPVNDAPILVNNGGSADEDTVLTLSVSMLDVSDVDNTDSQITFTLDSVPVNGDLELNGSNLAVSDTFTMQNIIDGNVTFAPNADENGLFGFNFTVSDGTNTLPSEMFTMTINPVNDAPIAADDDFTVAENNVLNGNVLADNGNSADSDVDGDALSVTAETKATAQGGSVTILANGDFTYTPTAAFNGADSFDYTLLDGQGGNATASVSLTVSAVDDAPIVTNNGGTGNEDTTLTVTTAMLDMADVDTPANNRIFTLQSLPTNGTLSLNAVALILAATFTQQDILDGLVTYEPSINYNGTDSFDFVASDGTTTLPAQTFNLNIAAVNDGPQAADDTATTDEDSAATINLLANDSDLDNDTLSVTSISAAANGSVVINPDNTITYTPNTNFNGTETLTYTIEDGNGGSDTATLEITVNPVNDGPVAQDDSFTGQEDIQVTGNVLADNGNGADSDIDGDPLSVVAATIATTQGGAVSILANGDFTYTPLAGFTGTDSFNYTVEDGNGGSNTGLVTFDISASGPPSIDFNSVNMTSYGNQDVSNAFAIEDGGDTLHLSENTWKKIALPYLLTSDTVLEFDFKSTSEGEIHGIGFEGNNTISSNLLFQLYGTQNWGISGAGSYNTPGEWMHVVIPVGQFYTGQASYLTFVNDHDITNPNAESFFRNIKVYEDTGSVGGNAAPIAVDDVVITDEDTPVTFNVLANDTDPEGDTLNMGGFSSSGGGAFSINSDGTVTFTPNANLNGQITASYTVDDGNGNFVNGNITITVNPVNDAPEAANDTFIGNGNEDTTGNVLGNDTDIDGDTLGVTAETIATAQGGSVTLLANGDFTYTPAAAFIGTDNFTYTLDDGNGGTDTAAVTLNVTAPGNDAPVAVDDAVTVDQDALVIFNPAANDTDAEEDSLTVSAIGAAVNGIAVLDTNGIVTYTPNAGFDGADSFTYTVSDGNGGTDTATVNVTVQAINPTITGTSGNDFINSGSSDDIIAALAGDDTIDSGIGNDVIYAGSGNDTVDSGIGNDVVYAGSGNDTVEGGIGDDTLYGDVGNDFLDGGIDDDQLYAGDGHDELLGGIGNDILSGGAGDDKLSGGIGNNDLYGGSGADTFIFDSTSSTNTIYDFNLAENDVIDISDILIGYDPLTAAIADFVQVTDNGTDSFLAVDADGGADNFVTIATLNNVTGLTNEEALETSGNLITV